MEVDNAIVFFSFFPPFFFYFFFCTNNYKLYLSTCINKIFKRVSDKYKSFFFKLSVLHLRVHEGIYLLAGELNIIKRRD